MKQLGNLAIVCAQRPEVLLQLHGGTASVHVGEGSERATLSAAWEDDEAIQKIIHELNFGKYSNRKPIAQSTEPKEASEPMYALVLSWKDDGWDGVKVVALSRDKNQLHGLIKKSIQAEKKERESCIIRGSKIIWEPDRTLPDGDKIEFSFKDSRYGFLHRWLIEIQETQFVPGGKPK